MSQPPNRRGYLGVAPSDGHTFADSTSGDLALFVPDATQKILVGAIGARPDSNAVLAIDGGRVGVGTSLPQVSLDVAATDAIAIPVGSNAHRPANPKKGYIRYNSEIQSFEGYGAGNSWSSLGGTTDVNKDTFIRAEEYPGSNDDNLVFFTSNQERMRITQGGKIGVGTSNPAVTLDVVGTDAVALPVGSNDQRPANPKKGLVRYNEEIQSFEGYGAGDAWSSLGGVTDVNKDTFISAEIYPGCNDDSLRFYASNQYKMNIDKDFVKVMGFLTVSAGECNVQAVVENASYSFWSKNASNHLFYDYGVGVGTSNPQHALDVIGTASATSFAGIGSNLTSLNASSLTWGTVSNERTTASSANSIDTLVLRDATGSFAACNLTLTGDLSMSDGNRFVGTTTDHDLSIRTSNVDRITVSSNGNVHVLGNVYSRTQFLASSNDTPNTPGYSFDDDTNTGLQHPAADSLALVAGGAELLRVDSNIRMNSHVIPSSNLAYDLGSSNFRFRDLYLSGSTIDLGGTAVSASNNAISVGGQYMSPGSMGMFRNRIINGDMRIDQRNNGGASTTVVGDYWPVDRWNVIAGTAGNATLQQTSTVPSGTGFVNSIQLTKSASSTKEVSLAHKIEGHNLSDMALGTSSAQPFVLSFWIRSTSAANTLTVSLSNRLLITSGQTGAVAYLAPYSIASANTWQHVVIRIPSCTIGTWNTTNGAGMSVYFSFGAAVFTTETANSWIDTSASYNWKVITGSDVLPSGTVVNLTGVQLEKGTIATPFEFRPYAIELQLCQRYFLNIFTGNDFYPQAFGRTYSTTGAQVNFHMPVPLRDTPVITASNITNWNVFIYTGANVSVTGFGANHKFSRLYDNSITLACVDFTHATTTSSVSCFLLPVASASLQFSSEI